MRAAQGGTLDWRDPSAYAFARHLSREHWAWEFLRRNPGYIADWEWFSATWQALEAAYGKPPDRDFARWKQDPRAYRAEFEFSKDSPDTQDDSEAEFLLIECWMGAKWGFHKFPLDPAADAPVIGEQLSWRQISRPAQVLDSCDMEYLRLDPEHERWKLGLGFDLSLPIKEQIETARVFLAARQSRLRREGRLASKTVSTLAPHWALCLRTLDARSARTSESDAAMTLFPQDPDCHAAHAELLREADTLANGGYRRILLVPES